MQDFPFYLQHTTVDNKSTVLAWFKHESDALNSMNEQPNISHEDYNRDLGCYSVHLVYPIDGDPSNLGDQEIESLILLDDGQ